MDESTYVGLFVLDLLSRLELVHALMWYVLNYVLASYAMQIVLVTLFIDLKSGVAVLIETWNILEISVSIQQVLNLFVSNFMASVLYPENIIKCIYTSQMLVKVVVKYMHLNLVLEVQLWLKIYLMYSAYPKLVYFF